MIQYTFRVLRLTMVVRVPHPDVVIGSSVHPLAAWAGMRLAHRYRVPFIFEVRDLWPQTLIDMQRIGPRSVPAVVLRAMEKKLYREATRIISLLPFAYRYITRFGIDRKKISWISNGVDLSDYPSPLVPVDKSTVTFMYYGAHGGANGLDNLLHALVLVNNANLPVKVLLRLIGDGPQKPNLRALAAKLHLNNVRFEDPVSKKAIPVLSSEADVFVFNLIDTGVFKFGISSNKLFDFLAAGRPVIFASNSKNNQIEDAGCGITVQPEDPKALADAMVQMAQMTRSERHQMGMKGRKHVETHFDYRILAREVSEVLDSCLAPK